MTFAATIRTLFAPGIPPGTLWEEDIMAPILHHCTVHHVDRKGEGHSLEVWAEIIPGERGNYTGHPDDRFPDDPDRAVMETIHADGWPVEPCYRPQAEVDHLRGWIARNRIEIVGAVLADWRA